MSISENLMTKVQDLIENMINPAVASHGDFVHLVDVKDNRSTCRWAAAARAAGPRM
jgi:Fe-S cluster biogenesis protein NfuA